MIRDTTDRHSWFMGDESFEKDLIQKCKSRMYDIDSLPKASVIICFHESEKLNNLLHTLHSIVQHSPAQLVHEIIMIADNSDKDEHKEELADYVNTNFPGLVKIYRSKTQLGLIRGRQLGASLATGDVIISMDAHMEVQKGWLEPLLYEIKKERKSMCSSTLDWLKPQTDGSWLYEHGPSRYKSVWFWWHMFFTFMEIGRHLKGVIDPTEPIISPCSVGTIWAIDRQFFFEIGGFDEGMEFWGGENIDLPIRVFMAGGKHVNVPCSHAAHLEEKGQRNYRIGHMKNVSLNYIRIVESLFDPVYKETIYYYNPEWREKSYGDISKRTLLKHQYQYNFSYYMENYYPELQAPNIRSLGYGGIANIGLDQLDVTHRKCFCIFPNPHQVLMETCSRKVEHNKVKSVGLSQWYEGNKSMITRMRDRRTCMDVDFLSFMIQLSPCFIVRPHSGGIFWNYEGELRIAGHILNPPTQRKYVTSMKAVPRMMIANYVSVFKTDKIQRWFHYENGPIMLHDPAGSRDWCITVVTHDTTSPLITIVQCDPKDPFQMWSFKTYTSAYRDLVEKSKIPSYRDGVGVEQYYEDYLRFLKKYKT